MKTTISRTPWAGRRRLAGTSLAVLALLGVGTGTAVLDGAAAATKSPCDNGQATGEWCHYLNITSSGPDYEAWASLVDAQGKDLGRYSWHEKNPKYTTWWWRYNSEGKSATDPVSFKVKLRIQSLNHPQFGWEGLLDGSKDTCFSWEDTGEGQQSIKMVSCAANDGPA